MLQHPSLPDNYIALDHHLVPLPPRVGGSLRATMARGGIAQLPLDFRHAIMLQRAGVERGRGPVAAAVVIVVAVDGDKFLQQ